MTTAGYFGEATRLNINETECENLLILFDVYPIENSRKTF